jgi:hypothetical protein
VAAEQGQRLHLMGGCLYYIPFVGEKFGKAGSAGSAAGPEHSELAPGEFSQRETR